MVRLQVDFDWGIRQLALNMVYFKWGVHDVVSHTHGAGEGSSMGTRCVSEPERRR